MQPSSDTQPVVPGARRLRLLIVTDEMEVGGSQRQIVNLALGLDRQCFEVTVAYFRNPSFLVGELQAGGVRVVHLPKQGKLDTRFLASLRRELQSGHYDVLHTFAFSAELWTAVARRSLPMAHRPPFISSVRGTYDWYGRLHWLLKRWVSGQSASVVANSHVAAEYACRKMGLATGCIDVIYNGVAPQPAVAAARERLRQEWAVRGREALLLFAGRLVDVKDVATLLRAMARLRDIGAPYQLLICGEGPEDAALQAQARHLGLLPARAHFLGQREDIAELIEASDLLILPSRQEGLSNVILEAMRGARAVVASRTGGNVELVEPEQTGLLFDVGDDAGLAQAIGRLIEDRPLRAHMGRVAAERVKNNFAVGTMVQAFERLYRQVQAQPGSPDVAAHGAGGGDVRNLG